LVSLESQDLEIFLPRTYIESDGFY